MRKLLWGIKTSQSSIQNAQVTGAVGEEGRLFFRYAVAVLAVFFCLHSSISTAATDDKIPFNIPQQRADQALTLFAEQANLTLVFPFEKVNGKTANRLVGDYPIGTAATILLQDTGLTAQFSDQFVLNIAIESKGKREMNNLKNKRKNLLASMVTIFATTSGLGQMAVAQGDEVATKQTLIDEIIVTAQKREQRLIDVPISIEALGEEQIKDLGIKSLDDLSYVIPNLSIRSISDSAGTISLRGISNSAGSSPHVGIYLDEIPLSVSPILQASLQPTDMQRVEVLRGPQGTLYGQGSTGGTIRYITNDPVYNEVEGNISTSIYSTKDGDMSNETAAVINFPVIDDRLAFRVVAGYKDVGGWIDQPDTGKKDVNDTQATNLRIKGLWQASDDLEISGMVLRYRSDVGAPNTANIKIGNGTPFYRVIERNGIATPGSGREVENDFYNLTLNYDFGFATLTSSSSHFNVEKIFESDSVLVGQTMDLNSGFLSTDILFSVEGFSQEIRFASAGNHNTIDWLVGVFYSDSDDLLIDPDLGIFSDGNGFNLGAQDTRKNSKTTAVFANVDYHLSEQLTLTAGGRYFEDDRTADFEVPFLSLDATRNKTFSHFSPMISLSYALGDEASIYASIAEGFRSGGFNDFDSTTYDPETVRTYEFGAKASLLDGRLSVASAVFFSQYEDFIAGEFAIGDEGTSEIVLVNPGEVEILGVEWSTQYNLSDQLSVGFNGHYIDTEFTKVSTTSVVVEVGDQLSHVPRYSYSLNAKYDFDWAFGAEGVALLDISEQGGTVDIQRARTPAIVESDSVRLLNAQIGAQWEQLGVRIFGRNLTNEREFTVPVHPIDPRFYQHRPRTLGVELSYQF